MAERFTDMITGARPLTNHALACRAVFLITHSPIGRMRPETTVFCGGHEFGRRDLAHVGMRPAQQGFRADNAAVIDVWG